jgi:hypothetical protein
MKGGPADRHALHWLLVLFAGLSLMAFAAVANLAWMLASVGAFDPLAAVLVGKSWVAILAALLIPVVVGMAGAFWYTVRWRAVLAAGYPGDRVHDARLALGAALLAIAAHGSFYWAGNPRCVELCGLGAFVPLALANLVVAVSGPVGWPWRAWMARRSWCACCCCPQPWSRRGGLTGLRIPLP